MSFESDQGPHRHVQRLKLRAPAEVRQVDDEAGRKISRRLPESSPRLRRAAGGDQIVDQDHLLARRTPSLCISISSRPYSRL